MGEEVLKNMRARVEQCRRLSDLITNSELRERLRVMAHEIEADIRRLESEGAVRLKD